MTAAPGLQWLADTPTRQGAQWPQNGMGGGWFPALGGPVLRLRLTRVSAKQKETRTMNMGGRGLQRSFTITVL